MEEQKARLPNEVADAIRKNLPEQVSKMLQERLAAADDAINDNIKLAEQVRILTSQVMRKSELSKREKALDARERGLDAREMLVAEEERGLKVTEAEAKLHAEQRITDVLEKALLGLVRNTEYRKAITGLSGSGYEDTRAE